jgi:hypothetical protein
MAIANVVGIGIWHYTLSGTGLTGNNQLIVLEVKVQKGIGHKGHVKLVELFCKGQFIDIGSVNPV